MKKWINLLVCLIFIFPLSLSSATPKKIQKYTQAENITLAFKKIPTRELVQFIAERLKFNLIMSDAVCGNLTLHFHQVTWQQALAAVLEMSGLVKKQKDNLLFVGTASEFATKQKNLAEAAPLKVVRIKIKHIDASVLINLLKTQPEILSSMAKLNCNPRENTLWVKEKEDNLQILLDYIAELDRPEKQILVTAKILNVDNKKMQELGIHFGHLPKISGADNLNISVPQTTTNALSIAIANIAQNQLLNLQIEALESTGHSKLIANPKIITQSRKTATIEAGEEIPYQESTSSGATSISFKKAALSLKVTPTLLPDGHIILNLEISQNKTSPLAVNGTPAIQTQELRSEVVVRSDETVILGGIFETSHVDVATKIPLIGSVPLIGSLLSRNENHLSRKELLILVTPHVLQESTALSAKARE